MKTIGIIGGMSWESTQTYYQILNETIKSKLGGLSSAKILLYSVDFREIEELQRESKWNEMGEILSQIAINLEKAGADFIIIATNTMHKCAPFVQKAINIPLFHIIDALTSELKSQNIGKIALFGTIYTMGERFYLDKLEENGFEVILPSQSQMIQINDIIYNELCLGKISANSKEIYKQIIKDLKEKHQIEGVVLGCTEIGLLISSADSPVRLFDTTLIHAKQSALKMLEK